MKPYYQTADGQVTIYHAKWEDVIGANLVRPKDIALIHDDPQYGVNENTNRKSRHNKDVQQRTLHSAHSVGRNFPRVYGDDKPYDPERILALDKPTVTWGANHYASRLPNSPSWILWDKREGTTSDDNADGEAAWTNLGGPLRIFSHLWRGLCRASETGNRVLHPTQKPEALSNFVFAHAELRKKLKRGDLVFVPRMGSGPDIRPAMARGYRIVLCDVEELYCRNAVSSRLHAMPKPEALGMLGGLFANATDETSKALTHREKP